MTQPLHRRYLVALSVLSMAFGTVTHAATNEPYRPSFHPDSFKGPPPGALNEVLVLATTHLSELPASFKPEGVGPVVDRLAAWRPAAIATEDLSGLQCDSLRRYPVRYAATVKDYCADPSAAERATGLDVPAANVEVERLLAAWPATPSPADRRHLAAIFLAAGERASALVQWLRLAEGERHAGDSLTQELVTELQKLKSRRNETTLIAAPLAAKLGLERVWSVDDHTADSDDPAEEDAAGAAMMSAWNNPASAQRRAEDAKLHAGLTAPHGLLAILRAYNASGAPQLVYRSDFGAALMEPSQKAFGRRYLAYWETRNLRMVANIRDVLGRKPGTRMVAIVGASHKGYYEAYLNQMHDVRLVDAMTVLK